MTKDEMIRWIEKHYGPIRSTYVRGTYLVVLSRSRPSASRPCGVGSRYANAVYDLYCNLVPAERREIVTGLSFLTWEKERRPVAKRLAKRTNARTRK